LKQPKRYVLIQADGKLGPHELETLIKMLEQRHGKLTLISVESPRTSLIVKTHRAVSDGIRESLADAKFGDVRVRTVLTSGNIGKLKRRVRESSAREDVQVLQ
jgi:RNase P/RNase MRP subunit POP5